MLRPFALHRPRSLEEAAEFLAEHRGEAALYAGGTELLLLLKEGLLRVGNLIDLKRVPGLGDITAEDGHVVIGAIARHRTVERSPVLRAACPIVAAVAQHVANVRVRTVGTVGGNLAFADPHSDLATLFLALDGSVRLWRQGREREIPLADFVRGPYETAREQDEVLIAVRLRPWPAGTSEVWRRLAVSVLHKGLLNPFLDITDEKLDRKTNVDYTADAEEAVVLVRKGRYQAAFLIPPTTPEELRAVVAGGELLPQKSTHFYPKLLDGLVFYRLDEG